MKTVKEISTLTGISVRALHYYDEIGLLKPTEKSEAGYRLYDDEALETLREILFFREFEIPLREIQRILEDPALNKEQILKMQKKMLLAKKERLERLIADIDRILKGEDDMNFEVFNKTELEELWNSLSSNMTEEQKSIFLEQYGTLENWKEHFLKNASSEETQKIYAKVVEWYGDKEKALEASKNPGNSELIPAFQERMDKVLEKLAAKKGQDVNSFEVKELIGEYDFLSKKLYQMEDVRTLMLQVAKAYQENEKMQKVLDSVHGEGFTKFFGQALEAFY